MSDVDFYSLVEWPGHKLKYIMLLFLADTKSGKKKLWSKEGFVDYVHIKQA